MDEISAAFEDLTPDQLIRESSYTGEQAYPADHVTAGKTSGRKNFRRWVDTALNAMQISAMQASLTAFSMLHDPVRRRYFQPDADETAPMYANRLHREAMQMGATWFFNAMIAPGSSHPSGTEPAPIDPDDAEAVAAALESGRLTMSVCWYAEMREGREVSVRSGVIPIAPDGQLLLGVEGELNPSQNPFAQVMNPDVV